MSATKHEHRFSPLWRTAGWVLGVILAYLVVGNLLHLVVFRPPPPDPGTFPRAGDEFGSVYEGFYQRILDVVDGEVIAELTLAPGAVGPPLHYHRHFAEEFVVREGMLHLELSGGVVTVGPGESHRVEPGVAHRPFNPGDEPVVVASDEPLFPQSFAACLAQIYPRLDEADGVSLSLFLQLQVIDPICDTHLANVPRPVLGAVKLFVAPAARALGYTNYDPALALHAPGGG